MCARRGSTKQAGAEAIRASQRSEQTDRRTCRQADSQTGRLADRQRLTDRRTDRRTNSKQAGRQAGRQRGKRQPRKICHWWTQQCKRSKFGCLGLASSRTTGCSSTDWTSPTWHWRSKCRCSLKWETPKPKTTNQVCAVMLCVAFFALDTFVFVDASACRIHSTLGVTLHP